MAPRASRLSGAQLALFSLPMIAIEAIEIPWRVYLPAMFTETLGLPLAAVGTLLMAIRLFDMLLDPLIGWASDRLPTRFGLRRPWMVASLPLIALGVWQVFMASPGTSLAILAAWCLVLHAGYTMMVTPHGGWCLEIAGSERERTRVMLVRTWVAAAGMPLILSLPSILERSFAATRAEQVGAMGLLVMLSATVSVLLVVRFIPEPRLDRAAATHTIDPLRQFAAMLRDRRLSMIVFLYALAGLSEAASSGTFIFFVEGALGLKGWASTMLLIQALVVLVALPLWERLSIRLDRRRALIGVFAWQACSSALALFLPAGMLWPLVCFVTVRSMAWGGDFMFLRAMVADVSGWDAEQGRRRSASYYALFNVTLKLAMSLGAGAALWLLALADFVPGEAASSPALDAVRFVYVLPTCFSGLAGLLVLLASARPGGPSRRRVSLSTAGAAA